MFSRETIPMLFTMFGYKHHIRMRYNLKMGNVMSTTLISHFNNSQTFNACEHKTHDFVINNNIVLHKTVCVRLRACFDRCMCTETLRQQPVTGRRKEKLGREAA